MKRGGLGEPLANSANPSGYGLDVRHGGEVDGLERDLLETVGVQMDGCELPVVDWIGPGVLRALVYRISRLS